MRPIRLLPTMALIGLLPSACAAQLTAGNLLVSTEFFSAPANVVREYTPGGALVQNFDVPYPGGRPFTEDVRDIVVDGSGRVQIYNGTFAPFLTTLSPATSTFSHHTLAGLSTVANVSFGGIGVLGDSAFLTDMATASPGGPNGIVQFDLTTFSANRFALGNDYGDLTVGLDGRLYAIRNPGGGVLASFVDVFDPVTHTLINAIPLSPQLQTADLRGIAVDAAGVLYGAAWDGSVYQFNGSGVVLNSHVTGTTNLTDIDLGQGGQLVVGGRFGNVILTNTAFSSFSGFTVGSSPVHVAFTSPASAPSAVPEPGAAAIATAGLTACLALLRRRSRA